MNEPALVVDRLTATLRYADAEPPPPDRLAEPLRLVAREELAAALREVPLPPGHWCLPRLDLVLPLDLDRPGAVLVRVWAEAVAAAVERALRGPRDALVHYPDDVAPAADAIAGIATGRTERLWAWRQTGLLRPGDPLPGPAPGAAILALLGRHPHVAAAVLRAATAIGLPPLDRALGRSGWAALAALSAVPEWTDPAVEEVVPKEPGPHGPPQEAAVGTTAAPATRALARSLLGGSRLPGLVRSSRLRPADPVVRAWAVLVAAETDPVAVTRPPRAGLPALLAEGLRAACGVPALRADEPGPTAPSHRPEPRGEAAGPAETRWRAKARPGLDAAASEAAEPPVPAATDDAAARPQVVEPAWAEDTERGAFSGWAGLLFLIATAADSGLPDRVLEEPALAARPLPWVLYAAGRVLLPAADPADPALFALTGLDRERATGLVLRAPTATPEESEAVAALASHWAATTAHRLHGDGCDVFTAVAAVARRPGRIVAEPGWIEAHFALSDAEPAIRRAGLDLDPGWVPWLGSVVRYVYA
ncbi:hypothetical protein [Streptomyces sp. IB201691-2A2]|uniref:hypothetical protein n=1 Tax=Streptomyces sp. IB201691-2A2 TaxID=2561920 RepID=UPI00117FC324|nr:hypothetical protein [Streptomyces sp. IB201691-2A2]TRO58535.1 hypothetical protein E4K73_38400 [Streptomyces sp. IB201691-2A2]